MNLIRRLRILFAFLLCTGLARAGQNLSVDSIFVQNAITFGSGNTTVTSNATANTVVRRDENGRAKIADPSVDDDIANQRYVKGALASVPSPPTLGTLGGASALDGFIVKTPAADLPNSTALGTLATGLLKNT